MNKTLEARLQALETQDSDPAKLAPTVVADDTPEAEIARLRRRGLEVYRWADFVERCVFER